MTMIRFLSRSGLGSLSFFGLAGGAIGVAAVTLAGAALPACGSNDHVNTDGGGSAAASDGGAMTTAGRVCGPDASTCSVGFCLAVGQNAMNVSGVCSSTCTDNAGCGEQGLCVVAGDAGQCYHACSTSTDCSGGVPCLWQAPLDAGICQPLPNTFCQDIGATSACNLCLGAHCCAEVTACAVDVTCAQSEGNAAASTPNATASALAACAADGGAGASCAAMCAPPSGDP
jgi:hypothetical protein